jgi:hypothetical protein
MPDLWMPGAIRHDIGNHAPTDHNYPAKAIAHITWDRNATESKPVNLIPFSNLVSYFTGSGRGVAPHILWDPFVGNFAQFLPADSRSFSVADSSGGTRTNRAGKVVIQIEALFFPYCKWENKVYAKLTDTPCKNWDKLNNWINSWGVLPNWPMGMPNGKSQRDEHTWEHEGGWYGHSQVPENTHTDPISWPKFVDTTNSAIPTFPGSQYFRLNAYNNYVTQVDKNLVRLGFTHHNDGNGYQPGPRYTEYTRKNVQEFQHSRGWSGPDADGYVGPRTWHDLFAL